MENWYDTQCPGKPLVDLTDILEYTRNCFNMRDVYKEMPSNYVYSQPRHNYISSTTTCKSTEVGLYDAWYTKSCKYNQMGTPTNPSNLSITSPSTPATSTPPAFAGSGSSKGLSKRAIAGMTIGAVVGVLVLGFLLYCCWGRPGRRPSSTSVSPRDVQLLSSKAG